MTRNPLPRHRTTITITLTLSAADQTEAEERLEGIAQYLAHRLTRTTFQRLAGMPTHTHIGWETDPAGGSPA